MQGKLREQHLLCNVYCRVLYSENKAKKKKEKTKKKKKNHLNNSPTEREAWHLYLREKQVTKK